MSKDVGHLYYGKHIEVEGDVAKALAVTFIEWLDSVGLYIVPKLKGAPLQYDIDGETSYADLASAWWEQAADEDGHRQIHYREA